MRICMLNDNYYRGSGIAIAIRRLVSYMPECEFVFAGCRSDGLLEERSWMASGSYRMFDLKTSNPLAVLRELIRFRQWLKLSGCAFVHCHHRRLAVLLNVARIPVLYTGHLAFPDAWWFRAFAPSKMTGVTPSVVANILQTTGTKPIASIGNPLPFPAEAPKSESDPFRAVCVGRLEPVKGHRILLDAWAILREKGYRYRLDIVGEGPLEASLKEQSRANGTDDLIHFCGYTKDVSSIVSKCLFAVLLSEVEGQGIVTLEAAALGKPSLLTAVPGSIDLLPPDRHLENGLRFGDVEGTAEALESWFSSPGEVAREGHRFFSFLQQMSDPVTIASRYLSVYREVASCG